MNTRKEQLVELIEEQLRRSFADVELVDLDLHGGAQARVTVYVDRVGGVDLALCEAVTRALDDLRGQYALEVSSPGLDRPLRTPAHFARAQGERIFVKTSAPRDGRSVFRGRVTAAGTAAVTMTLDESGAVSIPYDTIAKAHVIFDFADNGGQRE